MIGRPGTDQPVAGRYLLVDPIGSGGMGSVWRAYDVRAQRWVAVKVLGPHDGDLLLRFVREQGVRIQHPHVVAPIGWAAEDDLVLIAMDLVRGGSVQQLLAEHGPLPVPYAALLLDQLLRALSAVHAAGVVHRDVKPANLLLEATGPGRPHLRLGDFGVAAADDVRLTRVPGLVGTPGYAAPEQEQGAAPEPTQDLHAAGRVGIQLLTGLPPRAQQGVPDGPLAPLLTALTDPDPARRPATAADARELLARSEIEPWHPHRGGPRVPDRLGDAAVPVHGALRLPRAARDRSARRPDLALGAAAACFTGSLALCGAAVVRLLG